MDKGCKTCAHDRTDAKLLNEPCKTCVASGTLSKWKPKGCDNCKHRYKEGGDEPCIECFDHKGYPKWEPLPIDAELKARDETPSDAEPQILDSGERREFETGAVRDIQEGKGRCDLLPLMQVAELIGNSSYPDVVIGDISQYQKTKGTIYLLDAIKAFSAKLGWSTETAMLEVSKHFEAGCQKYGERNWEKGIPEHCYIDSAIRHYLKWRDGMTDEPHDRAVIWNLICLWWTHENITESEDAE